MQLLLASLKKEGYIRQKDESMHQFLLRCMLDNPKNTAQKEVHLRYEEILYANDLSRTQIEALKKMVRKSINNG